MSHKTNLHSISMRSLYTTTKSQVKSRSGADPLTQDLKVMPTSTDQHQASYFDEGTGFVYIQTLGEGGSGIACLVKSVANGKLYVRKEDFEATRANFDRSGASKEVDIAKVLKDLRGVAELKGWVKYEEIADDETMHAFYVTYWEYYNAGTLQDVSQAATQISIPERWMFSWSSSMLKTIIALHQRGIVHCDAHAANWFVHRENMTSTPRIVLGDFGESIVMSDQNPTRPELWRTSSANPARDFVTIAETMEGLSDTKGERSVHSDRLLEWANFIKSQAAKLSVQELESMMRRIAETLNEESGLIPNTPAGKIPLVTNRTPCEYPIMLNPRDPAFKRWKVVLLDGNTIVDASLRSHYSSTRCSKYRDQGDWDEGLKLA